MQKESISLEQPAVYVLYRQKKRFRPVWIVLPLILLLIAGALLYGRDLYTLARFGVVTLHSDVDRDDDFVDDYTDLMRAARAYVSTQPEYVSTYFAGGYPPEGQGVCTDVIWRALQAAGYDFKALLDEDVRKNASLYPLPNGKPDSNIDFRRVVNLRVYFERHCLSLTTDTADIAEWQPGDIVVYEGHVAIVSDRRNASGQPWIIHHTGHGAFEEDALNYKPITGHYRWTEPE